MPGVCMVGIEGPGRHDLLDLGDGHLASGRHVRIEVAGGLSVDEIAFGVRLPCLDDRKVGAQPAFPHIKRAVELLDGLAFRDDRAGARLGEEGRNAGAAGAYPLREGALRIELKLQLPAR